MGSRLVRDRVAEVPWRHEAAKQSLRKVHDPDEHVALLVAKILEEVGELLGAQSRDQIRDEAGDVVEAIYALCDFAGIGEEELHNARRTKLMQRGGFSGGLVWEI